MSSKSTEQSNPITDFLNAHQTPMDPEVARRLKDAMRKRKAYAKKTTNNWREDHEQRETRSPDTDRPTGKQPG